MDDSHTIYVIYHCINDYKYLMYYVKDKEEAEKICVVEQNKLLDASANNYFDYEALELGNSNEIKDVSFGYKNLLIIRDDKPVFITGFLDFSIIKEPYIRELEPIEKHIFNLSNSSKMIVYYSKNKICVHNEEDVKSLELEVEEYWKLVKNIN